jgi:integrase
MASTSKRRWTAPDGTPREAWIVRYTDASGSRRGKQFNYKKEADNYRIKVESELSRGEHIPRVESATVRAIADQYIKHMRQRWEDKKIGQGRYSQVEYVNRLHITPFFNKKLLNDLTFNDMEGWYKYMSEGTQRSAYTRSIYTDVLVQIEKYAVRRGLCKRTPVADYRREMGASPKKVIRTFSAEQISRLLAAAEIKRRKGHYRAHSLVRCAVHLAAFCGLRRGEIFGLTRKSIDLQARVLRIRTAMTMFNELKGPKTAAGKRDVPIPPHLVQLLQDWLDKYFVENERDLVFRAGGGKWQMQNFLWEMWHPLLRDAGLWDEKGDQFHFHALRHFAASWMIENHMSLPDVASLLGHSKFDLTLQVYAHPIIGGGHRHAAMDRMAANLLLTGATNAT